MYLPSFCSFRMTDIWRSLVAQRCLQELGWGVVFHAAEVFQMRNAHDYLRDFRDEISGYLENERLVSLLIQSRLQPGADAVAANVRRCYESLVAGGLLPQAELPLLDAWFAALDAAGTAGLA
jgi:hypothetical protein